MEAPGRALGIVKLAIVSQRSKQEGQMRQP
jgi:hypothetical protein